MANAPSNTEVQTEHQERSEKAGIPKILERAACTTAYTVFTRPERWLITINMGVAMFFSPMTANIYFPAIPSLSRSMNVSFQQTNLTITAYIVIQGVAPLFVGDLADKVGRRPVYILTFVVYVAASFGLAINRRSYAVLLALRMLQSAGCSATAAISYGVLADVAPPAKRGHMLGAAMVAANTGPTIGPLLGGIISDRAGWHWIFWFLTILGGSFLGILLLSFPETSRKIVKNGQYLAPRWNRPFLSSVRRYPVNAVYGRQKGWPCIRLQIPQSHTSSENYPIQGRKSGALDQRLSTTWHTIVCKLQCPPLFHEWLWIE